MKWGGSNRRREIGRPVKAKNLNPSHFVHLRGTLKTEYDITKEINVIKIKYFFG